ncbi:hypothetical protein LEMLEM_LOCUS304 [Lemmus lemmus]
MDRHQKWMSGLQQAKESSLHSQSHIIAESKEVGGHDQEPRPANLLIIGEAVAFVKVFLSQPQESNEDSMRLCLCLVCST